jgi:hypothetical protein
MVSNKYLRVPQEVLTSLQSTGCVEVQDMLNGENSKMEGNFELLRGKRCNVDPEIRTTDIRSSNSLPYI